MIVKSTEELQDLILQIYNREKLSTDSIADLGVIYLNLCALFKSTRRKYELQSDLKLTKVVKPDLLNKY